MFFYLIQPNVHTPGQFKGFQTCRFGIENIPKYLRDLIFEFSKETNSKISKKIISNYENELKNFVQVCPIEMLDKLDHPISLKELKSKSA